tara:strand:+ start:1651 stop:1839 length:189 start_codon:yes stop_codon:yes gene_type:complete
MSSDKAVKAKGFGALSVVTCSEGNPLRGYLAILASIWVVAHQEHQAAEPLRCPVQKIMRFNL